jgi:hypothetical protein
VSASLAAMFRRQDFSNVSFDKLLTPLVTAKTLSAVRAFMTRLYDTVLPFDASQPDPLQDVEVRRVMPDGTFETAHYSFDFHAVDSGREPRAWLVRVSDITARVQQQRELEDLRTHMQTQGEILRSVMQSGGARFGAFLQRTDAAMKTINGVLKKPAREADAFRSKLEETLEEVDRVRRDAAALKLTGLEAPRDCWKIRCRNCAARRAERQRFPTARRQARPALWAVRAALPVHAIRSACGGR